MTYCFKRAGIARGAAALWVCVLLHACGGGDGVPVVDQSALPVVVRGEKFSTQLTASGGRGPYRWSVAEGDLPDGVTLGAQTGSLQGQATELGHFDATVTLRDADNQETRASVRIDVIEPDATLPPNANRGATQAAGRSVAASSQPQALRAAASPSVLSSAFAPASAMTGAALPGLVGLISAMPEGSWVQVSLNSYADVWTPEELRPLDVNGGGPTSPSRIIMAWSSFAWDSNRGDLILYGGGHANHPGNDMYRWRGSTRMWERAALPSEIARDASGNFIAQDGPDAAPAAAHTFDGNIFLPMVDRFLTFGGAAYNNGDMYRRATSGGLSRNTGPYLWDPAKADPNKVGGTTGSHVKRVSPHPEIVGGQMWQNRDLPLNLAGTPRLPASHVEGCTGYAVENGKDVVYVAARLGGTATQLFRYAVNDLNNPALDNWTHIGGWWSSPQGQTVCTYDPVQHILVKLGDSTRPFTYWDVTAPGAEQNLEAIIAYSEPTGEFAAKLASGQINIRYCGLDFDPVRRQYALWCGGPDVWMLTPPAVLGASGWQLNKQTAPSNGTAPTMDTGTGILGKWKYIPNLDAFMALQDSTLGNIWIYKPVGWQAPGSGGPINQPPSVSLDQPVTGSQYAVGATIHLVASATDSDGAVVQVNFYAGSSLLGAGVKAAAGNPWTFSWSGAGAGSHTVKAVAMDDLGAQTSSPSSTVQVIAANQPPTVSLTAPNNDQQFALGQLVTLQASATDADGSIVAVDFYDGATLLAHLTSAPWQFNWLGAALGAHALSAVALDNQAASQTSPLVNIQVVQATGGVLVLQDGVNGYAGTRDVHLVGNAKNTNYGTATSMIDVSGFYAMMVRFAIFHREGGPVPDNAIIYSASLELYKSTYYSPTLSAYRLLCDWQELQATWNSCRSGVAWASGGATGAGVDYIALADAAGAAPWTPGWVTLDVKQGVLTMQAGAPNYGWRLRRTSGDNINTKLYHTREYASVVSLRPKLTVSYSVP